MGMRIPSDPLTVAHGRAAVPVRRLRQPVHHQGLPQGPFPAPRPTLPAHQNESAPGAGASGQSPPTTAGPVGHGRVKNVDTAATTSAIVDVLHPSPPPSPPRIPHKSRLVRNQGRTHSIRSISLLFLSSVRTVPFSRSVTLAHRDLSLSLLVNL
jgi:hypothetical protein